MISLALLPTMQKHYILISLLTMCHFVFHVHSVSEFNIQVYFASWRTWIGYVKHATERYSPLTSMCNAKTANVSIILHVWDLTKIHVISLPHGIALIVFKQYSHSIILMKMKISLVQWWIKDWTVHFGSMKWTVEYLSRTFEINQDSNTPFTEIDPDLQF